MGNEEKNIRRISIKQNYIFSLINQMVNVIIPLVLTPYISRILTAEGIGINSYTTVTVTYFTMFSMLGISSYGQQSISMHRNDRVKISKLFWELQLLHLVTFSLVFIVYTVMAINSQTYKVYYLIHYVTLIASFLDINWLYQAYEEFRLISIRNSMFKIILVILTFLFVKEKNDLWLYILMSATSTLCSNLLMWIGVRKYVDLVKIQYLQLKKHIREVAVYFVPTIAGSVYQLLDKSVIQWVTQLEAENGFYEQAERIITIISSVYQPLAVVSAPRMVREFVSGNIEEARNRLNNSLRFMGMIATPCVFGLMTIAADFVPLFFGSGYDKVINILYVFAPKILIVGFSFFLDTMYLVPCGKRDKSAKIITIGALINLILNYVFVSLWASVGAAISTLITECIICIMMAKISNKMINWTYIAQSEMRYILSAIVMVIGIYAMRYYLSDGVAMLLLQIGVGAGIYFIILILMKDNLLTQYVTHILRKSKLSVVHKTNNKNS